MPSDKTYTKKDYPQDHYQIKMPSDKTYTKIELSSISLKEKMGLFLHATW